MIEELVPETVQVAEVFGDLEVPLFPEEEAAVSRAVDKRRREFVTARACARQALARLGLPATPIVPGQRGAPGWPGGVVGSITHCDGYRACAVAFSGDVATIGLDAEPDAPLPDGVLDAVALPEELAALPAPGAVSWDRLLFSAKEAVYKAWFPLARRFLDFSEATVRIDPSGTFTARPLVAPPSGLAPPVAELLGELHGRWLSRRGLLLTAIVVPAVSRQPVPSP